MKKNLLLLLLSFVVLPFLLSLLLATKDVHLSGQIIASEKYTEYVGGGSGVYLYVRIADGSVYKVKSSLSSHDYSKTPCTTFLEKRNWLYPYIPSRKLGELLLPFPSSDSCKSDLESNVG